MKKILLSLTLILSVFLILATFVKINSTSKLPEGKNYLDSKNIYKEERFIYTDEPFLVKENTKYTFSISRDYVDGAPFEAKLELYEDNRLIDTYSKNSWSMVFDAETNTYYFSFTTPAKTNYIDLKFTDNDGDYETGDELINVQLEEGSIFTNYEPYVQSSLISSPLFLILFGGVVLLIVISVITMHYLPKNKIKKKKNYKK